VPFCSPPKAGRRFFEKNTQKRPQPILLCYNVKEVAAEAAQTRMKVSSILYNEENLL